MASEAREFMLTDVVVLALVVYALLGKLADVIVRLLERLTLAGIRPSRNRQRS